MLVGLACAIGAALCFGVANHLQAAGARRAPALPDLRRQPLYFLGLVCDFAGFLGSFAALQRLPLFVVQAVVSANVLLTAALGVLLRQRLGRTGRVALLVSLAGLVLVALSAQEQHTRTLSAGWHWFLLGAGAVIGVAGAASGHHWPDRYLPLTVATGLEFSLVAVNARTLVLPSPLWHILADPTLWALAVCGISGTLLFAAAFRKASVTRVTVITFTIETLVPSIVGLTFLGDSVRPGFVLPVVAGGLLAIAGAVLLSLSRPPPAPDAPALRKSMRHDAVSDQDVTAAR